MAGGQGCKAPGHGSRGCAAFGRASWSLTNWRSSGQRTASPPTDPHDRRCSAEFFTIKKHRDANDHPVRLFHIDPLVVPELRGASSNSHVLPDSMLPGPPNRYLRPSSALTPSNTSAPDLMRTSVRSYRFPSMRTTARPSRSACTGHRFHNRPIALPMYPDTT